jgi:hypothetical protein
MNGRKARKIIPNYIAFYKMCSMVHCCSIPWQVANKDVPLLARLLSQNFIQQGSYVMVMGSLLVSV